MNSAVTQSKDNRIRKYDLRLIGAPIGPRHPICRGDFAAIVFCGRTSELGELPGEPTAHALFKFGLPDPRLDESEDFAHSAGASLPRWPLDRIHPTEGVCFVFAGSSNPHAAALLSEGAKIDRHLVILDQAVGEESSELRTRLTQLAKAVPSAGRIVVLGFGHQGRRCAELLMDDCGFVPEQVLIHETNPDSQHDATASGFELIGSQPWPADVSAVIYSPLMRHERLYGLLKQAERTGLQVLDNSQRSSGWRQFVRRGLVRLDAASDGALTVNGTLVSLKPHRLELTGHVIREDRRRIHGIEFPHLQGGRSFHLSSDRDAVDLAMLNVAGDLSPKTLSSSGLPSYCVSLRNRPDHGYFAAREFCSALWPEATENVFPSEHVFDLGGTSFERLLQGHMVGREVVSTMQTPAQRTTLGIVSSHYSAKRPIIEIGSAFGGSALLMAAATQEHRPPIFSIDPETSTRDIMRFAFQREGFLDRLTQIIKFSDDAIGDLRHLVGKAGLVFIDGLHTEKGVRADFINYAPLVAPGGALLFHDVCPQIQSVMRVVFDEVLTDPRFEIKCLVDGLAVFERRCGS